ncbi:hypothetical protein [Caminibacter pacificus]|uniref:Uncharacterized protein n=1 Tax=Caminibacter pacificus TaxID=1424653 RepID=A0AAJ4UYS4_9BACT|nr:hypothetical protein [Caminibacter pacificus]ROR41197.1 hypothetical protein EDC58_0682 [Caminibacter pacificus]
MSATTLIYIVGISIFSMAFIFMFLILKPTRVTKEKLIKVLGKEAAERIQQAKDIEDIKKVIMSLKKSRKIKLKTLAESQNLVDALKLINEVLLENKNFASKEKVEEILGESAKAFREIPKEDFEEAVKKLDKEKRAKLQELFLSMDNKEIAEKLKEYF